MNRNKELTDLVDRLNRIFTHLEMVNQGHYLDSEEKDFIPPYELDWYYIIKTLNENGLEIKNKKEI